jgi:TatD DNase family protein
MFDSHCHLHDARIADAAALLQRARAAGVTGFLLAGVEPDGWEAERRLTVAHSDVAMALGVHPQLVAEIDDADPLVAQLDAALSGAVAVGEIGLDGMDHRAIARARELPVVLHVLRAHPRVLELLRCDKLPQAGGVLHSCSASAELVREYLQLGLHVSFSGAVCNSNARKLHEAARAVPVERLLVETDAPFQTPAAHRPADNEPAFLPAVIGALATLRGEPPESLSLFTEVNARRLFKL